MDEKRKMEIINKAELRYVINVDDSGEISKTRSGGIFGPTQDVAKYRLTGRIDSYPLDPETPCFERTDDSINIEVYRGEEFGMSLKHGTEKVMDCSPDMDSLNEMIRAYLPGRGVNGTLLFSILEPAPGDFNNTDLTHLVSDAMKPELEKLARAESAFIQQYSQDYMA